jgi:hypothetical protein
VAKRVREVGQESEVQGFKGGRVHESNKRRRERERESSRERSRVQEKNHALELGTPNPKTQKTHSPHNRQACLPTGQLAQESTECSVHRVHE